MQLYAGTKYHLSNAYYHQKIDYLFVDEAGQMNITDIIAIGVIAKNIVFNDSYLEFFFIFNQKI